MLQAAPTTFMKDTWRRVTFLTKLHVSGGDRETTRDFRIFLIPWGNVGPSWRLNGPTGRPKSGR